MHHGDAELTGHERVGWMNQPSIELEFAFVRGVNAGENLSEGAFARAVFADERMATGVFDGEAYAIERQHAGEAFGDSLEDEKGHFRLCSVFT
jgi:hypothetical protein